MLEAEDGGWTSIKPYNRVGCPIIMLHGSDDQDVPVEAGKALAKLIGAELQEIQGESHSLIRRHWGKTILPQIVAAAKRKSTL